jgi:hypothetical protein
MPTTSGDSFCFHRFSHHIDSRLGGTRSSQAATAAEAMTKPQRTLWASQHNLDGLATGALLSVAHNRSDCQNMRGSKAPAALLD